MGNSCNETIIVASYAKSAKESAISASNSACLAQQAIGASGATGATGVGATGATGVGSQGATGATGPAGTVPANVVQNNLSDTTPVNTLRAITQAEYDAISPKDPNTIYFIK